MGGTIVGGTLTPKSIPMKKKRKQKKKALGVYMVTEKGIVREVMIVTRKEGRRTRGERKRRKTPMIIITRGTARLPSTSSNAIIEEGEPTVMTLT